MEIDTNTSYVSDLKVCTDCPIFHYENCPNCFGLGLTDTGIPMTFSMLGAKRLAFLCPICGSNGRGLSDRARDEYNALTERGYVHD